MEYLGIHKLKRLLRIVKMNGGCKASLGKLYRMEELKEGCLVGKDCYGNKYYMNERYFMGRSRWVEYARHWNIDYDASMVPAEWHGWLHYMTDYPPDKDPSKQGDVPCWRSKHSLNHTGTSDQYYPYSTTLPKIQVWVPKDDKDLETSPKKENQC